MRSGGALIKVNEKGQEVIAAAGIEPATSRQGLVSPPCAAFPGGGDHAGALGTMVLSWGKEIVGSMDLYLFPQSPRAYHA